MASANAAAQVPSIVQAHECDDPQKSEWLSPADFTENMPKAKDGDTEAQRIVARCYMTGIGTDTDYEQGRKWYSKAAGSGDLEAQYQLGVIYRDGMGVQKNVKEAA